MKRDLKRVLKEISEDNWFEENENFNLKLCIYK